MSKIALKILYKIIAMPQRHYSCDRARAAGWALQRQLGQRRHDAAVFLGAHALALHLPIERGLAIDHIALSRRRYVLNANASAVNHGVQLAFLP